MFSVSTGIAIVLYKSWRNPQHGSFVKRLRPANPLFAYGAVAVSNFLSTMCQYEALRYVSYTTQSVSHQPTSQRGYLSLPGLTRGFVFVRSLPSAQR